MAKRVPHDIFDEMVENWPYHFVSTPDVKDFTSGAYSGKSLQNLAAEGEPVPQAVRVGRVNLYNAKELADWLRERNKNKGEHNDAA